VIRSDWEIGDMLLKQSRRLNPGLLALIVAIVLVLGD